MPRSYDNQVLLVGDAAGMIDPMTGEILSLGMFINCRNVKKLNHHFFYLYDALFQDFYCLIFETK